MPNVNPIFYVYEHWRPDKDLCFYVGKGSGDRAWGFHRRNAYYKNIVAKLARLGMCVEVRMVASALREPEALQLEVDRIKFWRGVGIRLTNVTEGGEGVSGLKHSPATKAALSVRLKGKKNPEHSARLKGRKLTPVHRKKIAESMKGRPVSEETREKLRLSNIGKHVGAATIEKLRTSHEGKTASPETRRKMSKAQAARWASAEARVKQSADVKKGYTLEVRHRMSELSRERFSTPAARVKLRKYARSRWHPEEVDQ